MVMWQGLKTRYRWLRRRVLADESGATTFEWTLLLAAIAIPSLAIIIMCLDILMAYYEMMTTMNALPFP
jgi:Flp pilus assembly pilin Flp